jgi:cytochrome c oxidase cbb3-type subunit 4
MDLDYHIMRQFADSWGLVAMMTFFICAVALAMRPSARGTHGDAASIPFREGE